MPKNLPALAALNWIDITLLENITCTLARLKKYNTDADERLTVRTYDMQLKDRF